MTEKDAITYTFKGIPTDELDELRAEMLSGVMLPQTKEYRIDEKDHPDVIENKKRKQAAFLKNREDEITSKLKQHTGTRRVGNVVFYKNESVVLKRAHIEGKSPSNIKDSDKTNHRLTNDEVWKLDCLSYSGVLHRKPELTESPKRPEMKSRRRYW